MDEDQILQSIIADPDVLDPAIDASRLRKTTETSPRLLGGVTGIEGLKYDPTRTEYMSDLYKVYSGGLPTIDVAQNIAPDFVGGQMIDTGGGGGGIQNQVTSDTAQIPGAIDSLVDVAPGEAPVTQDEIDAFNQIPVNREFGAPMDIGYGEGQVDPTLAAAVGGKDITPLGGANLVTTSSGDVFTADDPMLQEKIDFQTPEQTNAIVGAFDSVKDQGLAGLDTLKNKLSNLGGVVKENTVEIGGKTIDLTRSLVGGAISLVSGIPGIGLLLNLLPPEDPADTLNRNIVDELKAEKDYGFNIQSGNLNQDPFGRNPVSGFGDYEQTLLDDIAGVNQTGFQTAEMREKKKEFAQDYFNKKTSKTAPQEDIGATDLLEELQAEKRKEGLEDLSDIYSNIGQTRDQDIEEQAGGGGGTKSVEDLVAGYQQQLDSLEGQRQLLEENGIDPTEIDAAIENIKNKIKGVKSKEEEATTDEDGGGGADTDFDIDSFITPTPRVPDFISGGKDTDPAPSASAKTSQGVTTSQFQAFRDTGGEADTDPAPSTSVSTAGQAGPPSQRGGGGNGGGGSSGGGKIVCTMMNKSYGFGSFRNKIWMKFHKDLSPEYQKGYHKLFLPLVKIAKTNKVIKKVLEHIAVHSTIDMRQATRGKKHLLGRVYRKIILPICYIVGKYDKR